MTISDRMAFSQKQYPFIVIMNSLAMITFSVKPPKNDNNEIEHFIHS